MGVGENIRSARTRAGLTQKQLGEMCGIAEPTIRRYELNSLNPKFDTLAKIAEALDISVARLISYKANDGYWTEKFRKGLQFNLQYVDQSDALACGFDYESAIDIAEGVIGFTFEDACVIAEELGTSINELLDWKHPNSSPIAEENKPSPQRRDGSEA